MVIWYILPHFGKYYREKSGNPDPLPPKTNRYRVARFSLTHYTKTGENIPKISIKLPNGHKIYQYGRNIFQMDVGRIYQPSPFQGPPKFTQVGIFGLETYNLAALSDILLYK
jgi:hypothetical protein